MENRDLELGNIDNTQKSVQSLLYRVENEDNHTNGFPSIFTITNALRDFSPRSFNPKVVAIGPLHREDKNVQAFEGRKVMYMNKLLSRIDFPKKEILESCMHKVYTSMEQIKTCYILTKTYDNAEIAEMMVIDACFILEFIYRRYWTDEGDLENMLQACHVLDDFVLLENQIPFFILNEIFKCTLPKFHPNSLIELLHPLLSRYKLFKAPIDNNIFSINTTHHILSLMHECYKHNDNIHPIFKLRAIPSVVDLDRAGVNFKPVENQTWPMQMEVDLYKSIPYFFWSCRKPTLRMPVLKINDDTEFILRNLIAYEQLCETDSHITSYVGAIDKLVETQEDVAKLIELRVLVNDMGSNEEAANMINNICKDVVCNEFYYGQEWETLNKHFNGYWSKQIVKLKRTYFNSPWNMIALLAGIILFILTMVQTFFAIKPVGSNN